MKEVLNTMEQDSSSRSVTSTESKVTYVGSFKEAETMLSSRRRLGMQSEWSVEGDLQVFNGLALSIDNPFMSLLPPQFPILPLLDRIEECHVKSGGSTPPIDLIAPWVPDGPRSVHLPPPTALYPPRGLRSFAFLNNVSRERIRNLTRTHKGEEPLGTDFWSMLTNTTSRSESSIVSSCTSV